MARTLNIDNLMVETNSLKVVDILKDRQKAPLSLEDVVQAIEAKRQARYVFRINHNFRNANNVENNQLLVIFND